MIFGILKYYCSTGCKKKGKKIYFQNFKIKVYGALLFVLWQQEWQLRIKKRIVLFSCMYVVTLKCTFVKGT